MRARTNGAEAEGDPPPDSMDGIFRREALEARCSRRPDAILGVSGVGLRLSFWALLALTTVGLVAVATIPVPRTLEAVRLPDSAGATSDAGGTDAASRCRADSGEIEVEFAPHAAAMVPSRGTVELLTSNGSTAVAVRARSTDPTRRCVQLGADDGRDTTSPTVRVKVRGGTALDFILGGRR